MARYDDQVTYFAGLVDFLRDLAGPVAGWTGISFRSV